MAKKRITAIDFESDRILFCEAEIFPKERLKVNKRHVITIPMLSLPGAEITKEKVIDWDKLTQDLRAILKEFSLEFVVLTPPARQINTYVIAMPPVKKAHFAELVRRELEKTIAIPADHPHRLSFLKLGDRIKDGKKVIDVLVAIALQEDMANYLKFCNNLGLRLRMISIRPLALYSLMKNLYPEEANVAIVDIGYDATTIVIIQNGVFRFMRSMYIAIREFQNTLVNKLNLTMEEAEHLLSKNGLDLEGENQDKEYQRYIKALLPVRDRFSAELHRSILYYQERLGHKEKLLRIYLTGRGAYLKGVKQVLKKRLAIDILMLPFPEQLEIAPDIEKDLKESFPLYATALGLITISKEKEKIDLIPKEEKKKLGKKVYLLLSFIIVMSLVFFSTNYNRYRIKIADSKTKEQKLTTAVRSYPADLEQKYQNVEKKKKEYQGTISLFSQIQIPRPNWQDFFFTLANLLDPELLVKELNMEYRQDHWVFTIYGTFSGTFPEAQFILRKTRLKLEESQYFKDINFEIEKKEGLKLSQKAEFNFRLEGSIEEKSFFKKEL